MHYHTEGPQAVDPADVNGNGTPDQVEDALTQTEAARLLFIEVLGFPDPFQSVRFKDASFLDIHFRSKEVLKSNGVAFDEMQRFNKPGDPNGTLSLCFNIATSVKPSANLTPAHEYFHLIQNGVTFFKNSWYTEGTARWSESGLGVGKLGPTGLLGTWPLSEAQAAGIFTASYGASQQFWNPLAARLDKDASLPEGPALERLKAMTYVDGTPVLKDTTFAGWKFIREVLAELGRSDDEAFQKLGYDRWSEANQKSPQNNPWILAAVVRVVKRLENSTAGLRSTSP